MGYRVRRELVLQAIEEASMTDKGKEAISLEAVTGVSLDYAQTLLVRCEEFRNKDSSIPQGANLYALVASITDRQPLHEVRKRAYQLVMMAYYRILKRFVAARRLKAAERQAKQTAEAA